MKRFKGIAQWLSLFLLAVAVIAVYKTFDNIVEIGGFFSKLMGILSPLSSASAWRFCSMARAIRSKGCSAVPGSRSCISWPGRCRW